MPIRIAVDAMGGDFAPLETVKGAVQAAREYDIAIQLVGNEAQIKEELAKYDTNGLDIGITHTDEVIEMGEAPAKALRAKRERFVEWFNQKFDRVITHSEDGSISKKTYEKGTDKLVAWYDKDQAGNWTRGHIKYIPGGFGKTVCTETPKGKVIETVTHAMGNEKIERIEIPGGDWSKATTSIKETAKVPTQEEYARFLEQLAGAFDEMAAKMN